MQAKKNNIAFFLVVIVLSFSIKSAFFIGYYTIFTDTFIENFCVNQDNEDLQCDGKCYLTKVLDRDDSSEDKKFEIHAEKDLVFSFSLIEYLKKDNLESIYTNNYIYSNSYNYLFIKTFLRPPMIN